MVYSFVLIIHNHFCFQIQPKHLLELQIVEAEGFGAIDLHTFYLLIIHDVNGEVGHTTGQEDGKTVLLQAQEGGMGLEVGDDSGPVGAIGRGIHVSAVEERGNSCCIQIENWACFLKLHLFLNIERTEGLHVTDAIVRTVDTFP